MSNSGRDGKSQFDAKQEDLENVAKDAAGSLGGTSTALSPAGGPESGADVIVGLVQYLMSEAADAFSIAPTPVSPGPSRGQPVVYFGPVVSDDEVQSKNLYKN